MIQSLIYSIIWKERLHQIKELMYRTFEYFCLPRGVLRELEWCVYQERGFERTHWEEVLHANYVPEDLQPPILERMDELERFISNQDGMYHATLTLLLANFLYGDVGTSGHHQLSKACDPNRSLSIHQQSKSDSRASLQ